MKKGILYSSLFGIGLVLLSVVVFTSGGSNDYYTPREKSFSADGIKDAAAWLHRIRANQITGEINPDDVLEARAQARELLKKRKSSLGLSWEEFGPIDIGGRTRAFLIDHTDPTIMYAGSVSGGLFKTTNSGASWRQVNDMANNLAVVSIAQAPDGTIYYGTGEGMYYPNSGTGAQGIVGGGMYKSTDGENFTLIPSTEPQKYAPSSEWAAIGKIVVDPNNSNRIYAGTNKGIRVSDDGGNTWVSPLGTFNSCPDLTIDSQGHVWAHNGAGFYKSDGTVNGFTEISKSPVGIQPNELPRNGSRSRIAVSPQDPNYVYVVQTSDGNFHKAFRSTDGGTTWSIIGEKNMYLNPHAGQGEYNNALTVSPSNKDRIIVGGVTLGEWSLSDGWQQLASTGGGNGFPYYVHADNHDVVFHPSQPEKFYVVNDGGVFRTTNNGFSWDWIVKGYVTTQFYSIAVGGNGEVMGGTQDNGTIYINPDKFFPKAGVRTSFINFRGSLRDGDGGYAELSKLNDQVQFKEMQYGVLGRSVDKGESFDAFYDFDRMDPNNVAGNGTGAFADFVMPFLLWEKLNDPNSRDSITFSADSLRVGFGFPQGRSEFSGKFVAPFFKKTTVDGTVIDTKAEILVDGFELDMGSSSVTYDAANQKFVGSDIDELASSMNFYVDPNNNNRPTLEFKVVFKKGLSSGDKFEARVPISYDAGDVVIIKSRTNSIDIIHTLTASVNSISNPQIRVQDPVQSAFFAGLRTNILQSSPNKAGGIWMTRDALTNLTGTPVWYHIGDLGTGESPQCMAVSGDGDVLFVGTSQGRVYRFSNLSMARDSASTDIDIFQKDTILRNSTSVVNKTLVKSFGNRAVTSVTTHPFNKNKLIVTLGNYGNDDHVYYSNNAMATVPLLLQKDQANTGLPDFPVYAATFNYNDPTGNQVIIGTESGIYSTSDIEATQVSWTADGGGLANVPVFDLVQQLTVRYDLKSNTEHEGAIYAGTHGRGIFKTNTTADYIGIKEVDPSDVAEVSVKSLKIYPNPASERVFVEPALDNRSDVSISIRSIDGKLMKTVKYDKLSPSVDKLEVGVSGLARGTYIISLTKGNEVISAKMIKK